MSTIYDSNVVVELASVGVREEGDQAQGVTT